jgi:hypothetical protein
LHAVANGENPFPLTIEFPHDLDYFGVVPQVLRCLPPSTSTAA